MTEAIINWYEHHIKDYDSATAHLSWDEDMAYTRMLRWYYRQERPLPPDLVDVCRLVRAATDLQRQAVEQVLREFFVLQADGYHQGRADEVLAAYQAGEPERQAKKANEATRLARHREERAELFRQLTAAGVHLPWNARIDTVREAVAKLSATPPATPAAPSTPSKNAPATKPATASATPATATHYPLPTTHYPLPKTKSIPGGSGKSSEAWASYASAYEKRYGVPPVRNKQVNGQMANFITRIPIEEAPFVAAFFVEHDNALYRNAQHPVNLLLRDAESLRTQWATGRRVAPATAATARERDSAAKAARFAEMTGGLIGQPPPVQGEIIDMEIPHGTPRRLG